MQANISLEVATIVDMVKKPTAKAIKSEKRFADVSPNKIKYFHSLQRKYNDHL